MSNTDNRNREKILIVSYVFPPYPGIGGRRWAKFAKYFSRLGFEVHVICAQHLKGELSVWSDDVVKDENIHMHPVSVFYPQILEKTPVSILEKLQYRIWEKALTLKFDGYIYDRTLFSASAFLKKANEIIELCNIGRVIVTGAPFRLVHTIAVNRHQWKGIHLTADFRDPWTWEDAGSYQQLNPERLRFERKLEQEVIESADVITVPTLPMKQHLERTYQQAANKFMVLPHAWDEEEITFKPQKNNTFTKLVLFGTLYPGIEAQIRSLARAMLNCKNPISLDIYSDSKSYLEIFREEDAIHLVTYIGLLPSKQLYKLMRNYTAAVIINNDSDSDHVSTKFIELAASGTPVIYIARKGKASEFVEQYNTGWHAQENNLVQLLENISNAAYVIPQPNINLENLTFQKVSEQFLKQIYHLPTEMEAQMS